MADGLMADGGWWKRCRVDTGHSISPTLYASRLTSALSVPGSSGSERRATSRLKIGTGGETLIAAPGARLYATAARTGRVLSAGMYACV
jgi:hypothetical protein